MFLRIAGAASLAVFALAAPLPASAQSNCAPEKHVATGTQHREIDDATRSAQEALNAGIRKALGPGWVLGPRRSATYTCRKWLGGPAARIGWTCTLEAQACRDMSGR